MGAYIALRYIYMYIIYYRIYMYIQICITTSDESKSHVSNNTFLMREH